MFLEIFKFFPAEKDPVTFAIPFFVLLILIESYLTYKASREKFHYFDKENFASIGMGIGAVVVGLVAKGLAFGVFTLVYDKIWNGAHDVWLSDWKMWIVIVFADDFTFYWVHRLSHEIRFLWASHVNHHSSEDYTLATALRQSWGEHAYKYIFWLWLPLVGFPPLMVLMMIEINLIYQFWVHTKLIDKFPSFIEFIFSTPSHHRVHHASNIRYLDKNHGGILIIWDRIFGTYQDELDEEVVVYGITTNIHTQNLFKIFSHEYISLWHDIKNAPTFSDKLKYFFFSPGWSHNGKDQRAKTLQREAGM